MVDGNAKAVCRPISKNNQIVDELNLIYLNYFCFI